MGVATRIFVYSISQVHLSGLPRLIHGRCWGDFPQLASSVGGRCVMSALMRLFNDNSTALCQVPHHGTTIKEKEDSGCWQLQNLFPQLQFLAILVIVC